MLSYEVVHSPASSAERIINKLTQSRIELESTKQKLEPLLRDVKESSTYKSFSNIIEPFKYIKYNISDRFNTPSVSIAWLKMMEILTHFNILEHLLQTEDEVKHVAPSPIDQIRSPELYRSISGDDDSNVEDWAPVVTVDPYDKYKDRDYITIYDNAGLPGSFLLAIMHYILSNTRGSAISERFYWYANTQSQSHSPEADSFNLYANYQDSNRWIGYTDTSSLDGIKPILDFFIGRDPDQTIPVHLFVSDKFADLQGEFDKQEEIQAHTNYAQICCALGVLAQGGCMITKQFTLTTPATIYLLDRVAGCFEKLYLCKPISGKQDNSEIYVVGIKFDQHKGHTLYEQLTDELVSFSIDNYTAASLSNAKYLKSIYQASSDLIKHQIKAINDNIELYKEFKIDPNNVKRRFIDSNKDIISTWFSSVTLKPLDIRDWLDVVDTTSYQIKKPQPQHNLRQSQSHQSFTSHHSQQQEPQQYHHQQQYQQQQQKAFTRPKTTSPQPQQSRMQQSPQPQIKVQQSPQPQIRSIQSQQQKQQTKPIQQTKPQNEKPRMFMSKLAKK